MQNCARIHSDTKRVQPGVPSRLQVVSHTDERKPDLRDNVMNIMIHQYRSCALCENWKTKQKQKTQG